MWIFDRSRTTYLESVNKFVTALSVEKSDKVFAEIARLFGVSLEAAKNTYATPIFHLGVGYKVGVEKYSFGRTDASPSQLQLSDIEFRYTEPALLLVSGEITTETFLLMNIIRFQVLNSTLENSRFNKRVDNKVIPLLLTLQVLKKLEQQNVDEAYIAETELGFLYKTTDHNSIQDLVNQILDQRNNNTPAPPYNNADAFFNLFNATGVVIRRDRVFLRGARRKILVSSANRSMIVERILADPPEFFPITWDDKWKWAQYYASLPANFEMFYPPKEPFILKVRLPDRIQFNATSHDLTVSSVFASTLKGNDLVVWENPKQGLLSNVIYKIEGEPSFLLSGEAIVHVKEEYRCLDPNIELNKQF